MTSHLRTGFRAAIAAVALALPSGALHAQAGAAAPVDERATRIGFLGGWNSSSFSGPDAQGPLDRRNAAVFGGFVVKPFGTGGLAFRPELLVSQKGAGGSVADPGIGGDVSGGFALTYVELPLLLEYRPRVTSGVRPFVHAGPTLSLRTGCRLNVRAPGVNVGFDCDEIDELAPDATGFSFQRFDAGVLFGGGVRFAVGRTELAVGARFQQGFVNLGRDEELDEDIRLRNRVISLFGSVEFPLARRH